MNTHTEEHTMTNIQATILSAYASHLERSGDHLTALVDTIRGTEAWLAGQGMGQDGLDYVPAIVMRAIQAEHGTLADMMAAAVKH